MGRTRKGRRQRGCSKKERKGAWQAIKVGNESGLESRLAYLMGCSTLTGQGLKSAGHGLFLVCFVWFETENWAERDRGQGKCALLCLLGIEATSNSTTNKRGEEGGATKRRGEGQEGLHPGGAQFPESRGEWRRAVCRRHVG